MCRHVWGSRPWYCYWVYLRISKAAFMHQIQRAHKHTRTRVHPSNNKEDMVFAQPVTFFSSYRLTISEARAVRASGHVGSHRTWSASVRPWRGYSLHSAKRTACFKLLHSILYCTTILHPTQTSLTELIHDWKKLMKTSKRGNNSVTKMH